MSFDFNSIGKTSSYLTSEQATAKESATQRNTLNQQDFLELLTTQLSNQDPTSPVDNSQMVTTMSQLSVVQNLNTITSGMDNVVNAISSSSALSASSLVGRSVLVKSSKAFFDGENPIVAKIDAGSGADSLTITIKDEKGTVVESFTANSGQGALDFSWDGKNSDTGEKYPAGKYTIEATGMQKGSNVSLPVSTYATVGSVTLGTTPSETKLNLLGYGEVKLSDVTQISI